MPKREYALKDVNLTFDEKDGGMILLVGRSASGKSTILRLIAGVELPTLGCVSINGRKTTRLLNSESNCIASTLSWMKMGRIPESSEASQPVILDGKADFDDSKTVLERVIQLGSDEKVAELKILASDIVKLLELDALSGLKPSELSPSEQYLFSIACACMASVAPAIAEQNDECCGVPYPILLLDELFDTEVPSTVDKCSKGIKNLIDSGGVVISATHRPNYFKSVSTRVVTLSGGKVLTDVKTP